MAKIHTLDAHLTNMIAAGEVVERPSGILKELIENSLDAQADHIVIETNFGGLNSLRVTDNGCGLSAIDLPRAFLRHATSKISNEDDLFHLQTMGFRGEALPSIASVSRVVMTSNDGTDSMQIVVENGKQISLVDKAHAKGTSVEVSKLFYLVPARLKHLKTASYEAALNLSIVKQFAYAYHDVSFELISDGRTVFSSGPKATYQDLILTSYGISEAKASRHFEGHSRHFEVRGAFVLPHFHRSNRGHIFLAMNQRLIRSYRLSQAVRKAFDAYLPHDRYPIVMLHVHTKASMVDVNVHPSKWEIRLFQEKELLELVETCLKKALDDEMRPKVYRGPVQQVASNNTLFDTSPQPSLDLFNSYNPKPSAFTSPIQEEWVDYVPRQDIEEVKAPLPHHIRVLGQHQGKVIVGQDDDYLYLFDQHATMERVRYEYYMDQMDHINCDQQDLLVPLVFKGRNYLVDELDEVNQKLQDIGLSFSALGQDSLVVRSLPLWIVDLDAYSFIQQILDCLDQGQDIHLASLNKKRLATMACKSSIRFNDRVDTLQLQDLVDQLLSCRQPYHCPHGRPTFVRLDTNQLLKEFDR